MIETTLDSADGYEKAADDATSDGFVQMFRARAGERHHAAEKLKYEVRRLGEKPEDDGTILAAAHRTWLRLRDVVTGNDDEAIVAEVERGEDHIKKKFEDALENDNLTGECRQLAQDCYTLVKQGHDQMSSIKHSLEAGD